EDQAGDLRPSVELALRYADEAVTLAPLSSAAMLAKARVLEAGGRTDELPALVSAFLERVEAHREESGESVEADEDLAARITLLVRLAEIQSERVPAESASSLETAARLQARMAHPEFANYGNEQHKQLASLYERLAEAGKVVSKHKVLSNHRRLLTRDPFYRPSLRALARHHGDLGERQRARALYAVLAVLEPEDQESRDFLDKHPETLQGDPREPDVAAIVGTMSEAAGVSAVLLQLWDAGQGLISELFDKVDFDNKARVSPVGDTALSKAWREVLRRMGQTKVALVADPELDERERIGEQPPLAWIEPRCQVPPALVAGALARDAGDELRPELEFALARGLYCTRNETVMVAGLRRRSLATIISSALLAFHPRHGTRKQQARNAEDVASRVGSELARKLPIRVARQLGTIFKEHESEPFDTRALRTWIHRAADRVGVVVCGDVGAALRVLAGPGVAGTGTALEAAAAKNPDMRELVAYVVSGAYADARRATGFVVADDKAEGELEA
ncbi:MAG: hypothetical protein KC431_29255, partial [Myxococcales bacterium]|nr:hypothetical protein [Myxococcales bacterium]